MQKNSNRFRLFSSKAMLGSATALTLLGSLSFALPVSADVDPGGCTDNGGGISIAAFRADGTTNIGVGTVVDGENINYKATISALPSPNCAFEGGTWNLTTPDGVVHPLGALPRIGGTGVASLTSVAIPYVVTHANELVNGNRHINATTAYSGGTSHADVNDATAGPTLGSSKILTVVHTPLVTTDVHNASHTATTSVALGTIVHDKVTVTGEVGGPAPSGTANFNLYNNNSCSGTPSSMQSNVVLATSTNIGTAESNATTTSGAGMSYLASYNGDTNYASSTGVCEPLSVTQPDGHIIVDKVTVPALDPQSFSFDGSGGTYGDFALTDAAAPNDQALVAGTYAVSETVPAGWDQTSAICSDGSPIGAISLQSGETVTCTFTNTKKGHLVVQKTTDPSGTTTAFSITASGSGTITGGGAGSITDALDKVYEVTPGTYSVLETVPAGWNKTGDTCQNVVVAAGATSTCVITNTLIPVVVAGEYCSPGYWKQSQHFDSWVTYLPTQKFSSIFEQVTINWSAKGKPGPVTDPTLLQVLEGNGGGITSLARAAVGALLNASAINSSLEPADVIAIFNAANPSGDFEAAKAQYTFPENCPLN